MLFAKGKKSITICLFAAVVVLGLQGQALAGNDKLSKKVREMSESHSWEMVA